VKTPFHDKSGNLVFPWAPTADRAFIWPSPPPETFIDGGCIEIPDIYRDEYRKGYGILLAVGRGYYDKRGKWRPTPFELSPGDCVVYDVTVPWREVVEGVDGKKHVVVLCGVTDIQGVEV
jgi:co-chaperonin GroES (HSP10)